MSTASTATHLGTPRPADVDAALLLLERMGLSPADLAGAPRERPAVPTFAEYVPVVSAAVTAGTRRAYGSYWNRVLHHADQLVLRLPPGQHLLAEVLARLRALPVMP